MSRIEPAAWWRVQSGCLRLRRRSGFDLNPTVAEVGLWGVPAVVVGWGVRPDTPCNARPALRERIRSALLPNLILVILSYHPLLSYFILSDHISSGKPPHSCHMYCEFQWALPITEWQRWQEWMRLRCTVCFNILLHLAGTKIENEKIHLGNWIFVWN